MLPFGRLSIFLILASPLAAEDLHVEFDELGLEHRIEGEDYAAVGELVGTMKAEQQVVVETREDGRFLTPWFVVRGGALHAIRQGERSVPEVVESEGRRLVFRLQPVSGPFPKHPIGEATPEQVEKEVDDLLKAAEVVRTNRAFALKTDSARREFLLCVHVLAVCRDEDVPQAVKVPFIPDKPPANEEAFTERLLTGLKPLDGASERKLRAEAKRFVRGEIWPEQMRLFVESLAARAGIESLKSDLKLPITLSSLDCLEELRNKVYVARLMARIRQFSPKESFRDLPRDAARKLRDRLNVLTVRRRMQETATPAWFETDALLAAILRACPGANIAPVTVLAPEGGEEISGAKVEELLGELGLAHDLAGRVGSQGKREMLCQVVAWRAAVRRLRLNHLDDERIRDAVTTGQAKRVAELADEIAKADPQTKAPKEAAIQRLVKGIRAEQQESAASGIASEDLKAYYRPFPSGKALETAYRFLSEEEHKQVLGGLADLGLGSDKLSDLAPRDAVRLLEAGQQVALAATAEEASGLKPGDQLPVLLQFAGLQAADDGASRLWEHFRRYKIAIEFRFDPPKGPDRNASWRSPERLGEVFAGHPEVGRIELHGCLEPANGDSIDWWLLPAPASERQWTLEVEDKDAVLMVAIPGKDCKYLKLRANGDKAVEYRVVSEGKAGARTIRRFERREFYREIQGPPF